MDSRLLLVFVCVWGVAKPHHSTGKVFTASQLSLVLNLLWQYHRIPALAPEWVLGALVLIGGGWGSTGERLSDPGPLVTQGELKTSVRQEALPGLSLTCEGMGSDGK